ncbi:hypothetical protein EJ05DRAFT_476262 [Pseudovirgaria hyperparasitica]|uniref:Uncharacterized protein n=1 Tax=Pseudovirgaria hyperparasitica TaxID=470096 RepID=A0A6A6W7W6_9PEZI|nr:uncharacterized protein EJ05DRAFT_476262 [Pseudovirgaria hyperparasitica]KAF2757976.1 hypothetical protein EJ05DRAFT_476262 [Pseudovirgaria hyperparasitica]
MPSLLRHLTRTPHPTAPHTNTNTTPYIHTTHHTTHHTHMQPYSPAPNTSPVPFPQSQPAPSNPGIVLRYVRTSQQQQQQ